MYSRYYGTKSIALIETKLLFVPNDYSKHRLSIAI